MKKRMRNALIGLLGLITLFCYPAMPIYAEKQEPVELVGMRTADSKTFLNPDGTYEYVGYAGNVHYETLAGNYAEISHELINETTKSKTGNYSYINEANAFSLYFGDYVVSDISEADEAPEEKKEYPVSIYYQDAVIAMRPYGGKAAKAEMPANYFSKNILQDQVTGNDYIIYRDVYPGIDIAYISTPNGLKENIIIKEPTDQTEFLFELYTENVEVVKNEAGQYVFIYNDEIIFYIEDLFMVDQAEAYSFDVQCAFIDDETGQYLKLSVDKAFLRDPARVYPIIIDPTIIISSSATPDSFVASKSPGTNYNSGTNMQYLRTGRDDPYYIRRTYIKFTIPSYVSNVTDAYLRMKKASGVNPTAYAYRVTSSWASSSVTWNNQPSHTTSDGSSMSSHDGNDWFKVGVTVIVRAWTYGVANHGFMVRDQTESGTSHWTTFYSSDAPSPNKPELHIIYTGLPTYTITYNSNGATAGSAPASQSVQAGQAIVLSANTGGLVKAGHTILGWNTNSAGTGTNYSFGQILVPTSSLSLYARWSSQIYPPRSVSMKLWVETTYKNQYPSNWSAQAAAIATRAAYPFYQTYNLSINRSSPTEMDSQKSHCPNSPNRCITTNPICGSICINHHTNADRMLDFVSKNGSSGHGLNTMFYYGETCRADHNNGVGGLAYRPGNQPMHQASMVQCLTSTDTRTIQTKRCLHSANLRRCV